MTPHEQALAVLDERERLAFLANGFGQSPWRGDCDDLYDVSDNRIAENVWAGEISDHIAANDPATVLRECAGWRAVLNLHAWIVEATELREYDGYSESVTISHCSGCDTMDWDARLDSACPTVLAVYAALGVQL